MQRQIWSIVLLAVCLAAGACKSIHTGVEIDAGPEQVRAVFLDTSSYAQWNSFMRLQGQLEVGQSLQLAVRPVGGDWMEFQPEVQQATEDHWVWLGRLLMPGIFDGEHGFRIEALPDNRTRFVQYENFSGLLVPLIDLDGTRQGFELMNQQLKARVESQP